MSTRKVPSSEAKDVIYWRYHWKKNDPVMVSRKLGAVNWVLLREKLNEMNGMHEKEINPHTLRAQIIASQLENITRGSIPHQNNTSKIGKESTVYTGGPYTKGMTPEERKQFFRTKLNQKAREGFRFWISERPKPTKCKNTIQCNNA
ncbi:unnamed protein product [Heterobilharzia americana]|nr:unnamed protein product [Heterobilharzia americana]